jgi:Ca-activated chloride channel family protein
MWVWAAVALALGFSSCSRVSDEPAKPQPGAKDGGAADPGAKVTPAAPAKEITIDLDKAVGVELPAVTKDLQAVAFTTSDKRKGWVVRLPGNRPIATPAYADGKIFVGGGYGSHEFYAFDARTGKLAWQIKCSDDGPTAAVVEDGCCCFNTESCTIIVTDARTGRILWQEWLGDPLMSQPAAWKGMLYMAYPGGSPRGPVVYPNDGEARPANAAQPHAAGPATGRGYRLLCADLRTGRHIWEQDITADVITAPAIDGARLYFTCMDGTSFCLDAESGAVVWKKGNAGTSAPLIARGQFIHTRKIVNGKEISEGIVRLDPKGGTDTDQVALAPGKATYFERGRGGNAAMSPSTMANLDSSVGFGGGGPVANSAATDHLNVQGVANGWSYQGSRAAYSKGQILNAQGSYLNCISAKGGEFAWRGKAVGRGVSPDVQMFSPPSLGRENLYVCSAGGHILSLRQKSGELDFAYKFQRGIAFQPCLAGGNVYAGTVDGLVICIEGGKDADGWTAWGGNAQHNKAD